MKEWLNLRDFCCEIMFDLIRKKKDETFESVKYCNLQAAEEPA